MAYSIAAVAAAAAKSLQLCPTLCDPMACSLHVALSMDSPCKKSRVGCQALLQGNLPDPGIEPTSLMSSALADGFFTISATSVV